MSHAADPTASLEPSPTRPCPELEFAPTNVDGDPPGSPEAALPHPVTPYASPLPIPARVHPDRHGHVTLYMVPAKVRLHPELTETPVWTYHYLRHGEGVAVPLGPTIEVHQGQRIRVDFVNGLIEAGEPAKHPVVAAQDMPCYVRFAGTEEFHASENLLGFTLAEHDHSVTHLPPWTVVHLHGGRTEANSDGWPEIGIYPGQVQHDVYANEQPGTLLWYHDHGMGITRLNVYAGLAGLYIIRDPIEYKLRLPHEPAHEIPLVIQDRALTCDGDHEGTIPANRLLHKTGRAGGNPIDIPGDPGRQVAQAPMEFFGPLTLVNGAIWPRHSVNAGVHRLRILNGSNARTYRLRFCDATGTPVEVPMQMIGSDGGLLARPLDLNAPSRPNSGSLTLAPAERMDVLVDFSAFSGQRIQLLNFAGAPFDGKDAPADDSLAKFLPFKEVMCFDVGEPCSRFAFLHWDQELLASAAPWSLADLSSTPRVQRLVALVEDDAGVLQLMECALKKDGAGNPMTWDETTPAPSGHLALRQRGEPNALLYCLLPGMFSDAVRYLVRDGDVEVWKVINLTGDTHPMHIHLIQFKLLQRSPCSETLHNGGTDPSGYSTSVVDGAPDNPLDPADLGWKDSVRIDPQELVTIAMPFRDYAPHESKPDDGHPIGITGRYVYHCHILEHEDHEMMRPFVVMPSAVIDHMHSGHATHNPAMPMSSTGGAEEPSGWYMAPGCGAAMH